MYQLFIDGAISNAEWSGIRPDLLEYCGLDTMAMARILEALYKMI
jgi:hypothetical protein